MTRQCIQPRVPQLAVIGFTDSLSNLYTAEMISQWLVEFLDDTFKPPSVHQVDGERCRKLGQIYEAKLRE